MTSVCEEAVYIHDHFLIQRSHCANKNNRCYYYSHFTEEIIEDKYQTTPKFSTLTGGGIIQLVLAKEILFNYLKQQVTLHHQVALS